MANFNFGEALAQVFPLLDLVFEYLTYPELEKAGTVCKLWRPSAERTLQKRKDFKLAFYCLDKSGCVRRSEDLLLKDYDFVLSFNCVLWSDTFCYHTGEERKIIKCKLPEESI